MRNVAAQILKRCLPHPDVVEENVNNIPNIDELYHIFVNNRVKPLVISKRNKTKK
jgi:hypothetical protein